MIITQITRDTKTRQVLKELKGRLSTPVYGKSKTVSQSAGLMAYDSLLGSPFLSRNFKNKVLIS